MAEDSPKPEAAEASQSDATCTVVLRPEGAEPPSSPAFGRGPSDDYAICGKIGDGGMGVVYLARDRRLGRYVAIKRLNEKALADPVLRQRFLHEARAVAALNHAYIVHIYALGEDALGPYIVMEYVSGPAQTEVVPPEGQEAPPPRNMTLEQFIGSNGPMTADEAVAMILKIARTMVYAHSCGVIHRDLKPANILLDPSQEPKLVDFGLARVATKEGQTEMSELTVPGEKLISLGYSAPELEQDASTSDVRADIYSLGAILYFLLTGRNPRYYREQDVPAFLREVLRRSLETVREQRYRTAQDFVRALTEAASHGRTVAPTVKTTWRCKWCDAVNPISTKFCAECGWDGSERCLECGAETFVGQQFCPSCGADCRMYEHVASIVRLMDQAWEDRHFERIGSIAGRLHGFEPSGPTGRKLLTEAHAKVEEAERKVARRNRLAALIPNELKAENYERAQAFIEEFRALNEDPMVYEEELRNIPSLILSRDLVRVRQCIRGRDWATVRNLVGNLAAKYGDMPEYQDVRARLRAHDRRLRRTRWGVAIVALVVLYLLSFPWAGRWAGGTLGPVLRGVYAPVRLFAAIPGVSWALKSYVAFCDEGRTLADYFPAGVTSEEQVEIARPLPDGAEARRQEFEALLGNIAVRRQTQDSSLLVQYAQGLSELRRDAQKEGDYDGVMAAERAIAEYAESNALGAPREDEPERLAALKRRVAQMRDEQAALTARQTVSAARKYIAALDEARKGYTQRGEMEQAGAISDEIRRVRLIPSVVAAEELLAKTSGQSGGALPAGAGFSGVPSVAELEQLRASRETLRQETESLDAKATEALGNWPQQYSAAVRALMERFRQSGNFNAWEAASGELARFEEQNTLHEEDVAEYPEGLRQTQEAFLQRLRAVAEERDAAKLKVYQAYLGKLEKLKSDLTKQGRMDAAAAVNLELRQIRKSPLYLSLSRLSAPEEPFVPEESQPPATQE